MVKKKGVLCYDRESGRYDIYFGNGSYYGGLHCGDCFDVEMVLSRKLNDALSSRLFYAHFDSHRDISHFKSSCFCELFF